MIKLTKVKLPKHVIYGDWVYYELNETRYEAGYFYVCLHHYYNPIHVNPITCG